MSKPKLSAERARELFSYDPETGELRWRVFKGTGIFPGKRAGVPRKDGYLAVCTGGSQYLVHRVAWLIANGSWPQQVIDHVNGDPADNRLENLRDVSSRTNQENQRRARSDSAAGRLGVGVRRRKFRARIKIHGVEVGLGSFTTAEAAHEAYLTAKRAYHEGCAI